MSEDFGNDEFARYKDDIDAAERRVPRSGTQQHGPGGGDDGAHPGSVPAAASRSSIVSPCLRAR